MRFFFNVRSADEYVRDDEGTDCADADAALYEAEISARELLMDEIRRGGACDGKRFEVTDSTGQLVFTYPFRAAIKLP